MSHGVGTKIVKVFWGKSRGKVGKIVQMFVGGKSHGKGENSFLNCVAFWGMEKRLDKCAVVWKVCVH